MSNLLAVANKAPIVSTFGAEALRESPTEVRDIYDWHAATYVEQIPLAGLRQSFINAVHECKTPKACLVAPFGYGKTVSAVGIWRACQAEKLLAIPPISCGSFTELARAIYDWLIFVLPERCDKITAAHDRFLASSAEALARRDEQQFGIPFDQAFAAITDKLERGYLDFEDVSVNLLAFLEQATTLVLHSGYSGLVIIIDEMQQLLGNASKGVLVALRQLIWGLRTRQLPLGLLLTMDPDTERTLADRAGDILHRIKDDGLYLDIRNIYDRTFPTRLWSQYVAAFDLHDDACQAVDKHCLEALGQLCERDDLSNGPRTVINVLQLAAGAQHTGPRHYNPIDLVDDFISGAVHFDGDRAILPALVTELLNFPYFQRAPQRASLLKLVAAFPRGCPESIAAAYGLDEPWRDVSDDLRGDIVTELDEGLALIELQRVGRPANQLNVLLRRYWMQITDQQLFVEDASRAFTELVLPLIFPGRVHDLSGWAGVRDVQLTADGAYAGMLEGTTSPSYPLRRVVVVVISGNQNLPAVRGATDADFRIIFRLDLNPSAVSKVTVSVEPGVVEFSLALARISDKGLHGGLRWIEHYLSPQPVSVAVVLSLLRHFARERVDEGTSRDQARIEDTVARLRAWLLAELLPAELLVNSGFDVVQAGYGGFQEFLYLFASRRWSKYQTLIVHQHWATLMSDYMHALDQVPPAARIGLTSFKSTKAEIAALFGQTRHAGFESRARQYGELLSLKEWRGDSGIIRFAPHPMELQLTNEVRSDGLMPVDVAYQRLRTVGYSSAEADVLLRLASTRGLMLDAAGTLQAPQVPAGVELVARAYDLLSRVAALYDTPEEHRLVLTSIVEDTTRQTDPLETGWQLDRIEAWMAKAEAQDVADKRARSRAARDRILAVMPKLSLLSPHPASGELRNHITALHDVLEAERRQLELLAEQAIANQELYSAEVIDALYARIIGWSERAELYERWTAFAQRILRLQSALDRLDSGEPLADIRQQLVSLVRAARAVLAEIGIRGLNEIGCLVVLLSNLEQEFELAGDERRDAYNHVALDICSQAAACVGLSIPFTFPSYDASDDERSFQALHHAIATALARSIALLNLEISDEGGSKQEKLARAKLRSDIRSLAHHATNTRWVLTGPRPLLRNDARKAIAAIRERVAREVINSARQTTFAASHLVKALSALPPGPTNVVALFEKLNGSIDKSTVLEELVRLHEEGAIRLTVDVDEGS